MAAQTNRDIVDRFVAAMKSTNLDARDAVIADDAVEMYPQSGERFRGRANLRALIERYPGGDSMPPAAIDELIGVEDRWVMTPAFTAMKIAGGGEAYTVTGRVTYANGEEWHLIQLLRVAGGRVTHLTTYFAPPFEAAEWRAPFGDATEGA